MRKLLSLVALLLSFMPIWALASPLEPPIGSLIARQPDAPVVFLGCYSRYSPVFDQTYANVAFAATEHKVKAVTFRLALLGMDRRVISERFYTLAGSYAPGIRVAPRATYYVGRSYANGTTLCAVSSVELADGSRWFSNGSDKPWNPMDDVLWGDEPR